MRIFTFYITKSFSICFIDQSFIASFQRPLSSGYFTNTLLCFLLTFLFRLLLILLLIYLESIFVYDTEQALKLYDFLTNPCFFYLIEFLSFSDFHGELELVSEFFLMLLLSVLVPPCHLYVFILGIRQHSTALFFL